MELKQFLQSAFNKQDFIQFISERFYGFAPNLQENEYLGKVKLDDRSEIGFFVFEVNEHKDIENSRVGFHKELKTYADEHMLDGAIGAFYHPLQHVWRLSFVRFNYDDKHKKETTSQKRFTFLLGNEKIKTALEQLKNLKYPKISELEKAFSVESVTKEFYKGLVKEYEKLLNEYLTYPTNSDNDKKEFAIRLIGRILFIKFLNKKVLIPDDIFSTCQDYYHEKLEPLFFEQLNTQKVERKKEFANDSIPFLNGGLFEPLHLDYYDYSGVSNRYINMLKVDDRFFSELYEHLNQFNFTIDENSIEDSDLSIDPEMLGRIFENLLAEINPETSQNARKSTGSYYTPREIVEYMVNSSLLEYIKTKTEMDEEVLKTIIFKSQEPSHDYDKTKILSAIFELKILDPACGSGAFPMGLLQRIVKILELIDEDATIWFNLQNREFKDAHKNRNKNYIRKLSIIKNTIYGIDIQPIAIEISKLRFFLSLIVDEEGEPEPLPNLEFKFVCANSLLPLYEGKTDSYKNFVKELQKLKDEYFESSGKRKKEIVEEYISIRDGYSRTINEFSQLLGSEDLTSTDIMFYNPFDPVSVAPFFDSYFMFNVRDGFDIVIGNPPYLRVQGIDKIESEKYKKLYKSATGSYDLYVIFTERAIKLLGKNGLVSFIMPHKWVNSAFGKGLREVAKEKFFRFISFREYQVFNASTYTSLVWFKNKSDTVAYIGLEKDLQTNSDLKAFLDSITEDKYTITKNEKLNNEAWTFSDNQVAKVLAKLDEQPLRVKDIFEKIFQGIATSKDSVYILDDCKIIDNFVEGYSKELNKNVLVEKELLKPIIKGDDVKKYQDINSSKFVIFPYYIKLDNEKEKAVLFTENEIKEKFIQGYKYLKECENILRERENGRLENDDYWFRYIYPKSLIEFEQEKIVAPDITMGMNLTIDKNNYCLKNGTYGILIKDEYKNLMKFYLSILNSKLMWWFIQSTGTTLANGYFRFNTNYINPFPLPKIENIEDIKPFEILVDYIIFAKSQNLEDETKFFEWVVDVMVYGLYFTESMKKHDCYIYDEVAKLIKPFGKHDSDAFKIEYIKTLKNVMDEEKGIKRGLLFSRNVAEVEVINGEKR